VKSKYPVDQGTTNPIGQTPFLDVDSKPDTENKEADCFQGKAVIILDPTSNPIKANGATNPFRVQLSGVTPTNIAGLSAGSLANQLASSVGSVFLLNTYAVQQLVNSTTGNPEGVRTATVYKNIYATGAGPTALWTSGAGKKWRILGGQITISQTTATAAGPFIIRLLDVAADTGIGVTLSTGVLPATAASLVVLNLANIGNGILAAATNTALNVDLSNACTAGGVSIQVWGCEE
jgi:hypothetical protein